MRNFLQRLWGAYRMELRLLCWHWSYLLLHLLWIGLLYVTDGGRFQGRGDWGTARMLFEHLFAPVGIGLVSLIALFVAAASASRSQRTQFAALEDSLPAGVELFLGRWLAGLTGLMGALVEPLAIAYWVGPPTSFWSGAPLYVGQGLIVFAAVTAGTWVLVEWLGMRRWGYPMLAAGWLGLALVGRVFGGGRYPLPFIALLDFIYNHSSYMEPWGNLRAGRLPLWFHLLYLGLALLFVTMIIFRQQAMRLRRHLVLTTMAMLLLVAFTVGSGTAFSATVADWNDHGRAIRTAAYQAVAHKNEPAALATAVDGYDLNVDLTDPSRLQVSAVVRLRNQAQVPMADFGLTLSQELQVTSADVAYQRDGHMLRLHLPAPLAPGQTLPVHLQYSGKIWSVQEGIDPYPIFFTDPQGVRLSVNAGWYPVAGFVSINPQLTTEEINHAPAVFHLHVNGPAGWQWASNLLSADRPGEFQAQRSTWAMLAGSPRIAIEQVGDITVAAAQEDIAVLGPGLERLDVTLADLHHFLPDVPYKGVNLLALGLDAGVAQNPPAVDGRPVFTFSRGMLTGPSTVDIGEYYWLISPLMTELWGQPWSKETGMVKDGAGVFLWLHAQCHGDATAMTNLMRRSRQEYPVTQKLLEIYTQHGEAATVRVLSWLRQHPAADLLSKPYAQWDTVLAKAVNP